LLEKNMHFIGWLGSPCIILVIGITSHSNVHALLFIGGGTSISQISFMNKIYF
jgi:hypothetical protein